MIVYYIMCVCVCVGDCNNCNHRGPISHGPGRLPTVHVAECVAPSHARKLRPRTHWQFYPTRVPFANGSRRVARVHTASTASGWSGTLRPHQDVFAVDANGSRRLGSAVWMLEWTRRARRIGNDVPSAHVCRLPYLFQLIQWTQGQERWHMSWIKYM